VSLENPPVIVPPSLKNLHDEFIKVGNMKRDTISYFEEAIWHIKRVRNLQKYTSTSLFDNIPTVYCGLGIVTPLKKSLFEKISMCLGSSSPVIIILSYSSIKKGGKQHNIQNENSMSTILKIVRVETLRL